MTRAEQILGRIKWTRDTLTSSSDYDASFITDFNKVFGVSSSRKFLAVAVADANRPPITPAKSLGNMILKVATQISTETIPHDAGTRVVTGYSAVLDSVTYLMYVIRVTTNRRAVTTYDIVKLDR